MIIITNPKHVEYLRNLRSHPKYLAYTAKQFSEVVRSLFPEYREIKELDQDIQEVIELVKNNCDHSI